MNNIEEFEFWVGEFLENPQSLESKTWRIFVDMYARGNLHAIAYYDQIQRDARRDAIERGEILDPERPLNTIGTLDAKDVNLSVTRPNLEADYPKNWAEISSERKARRNWQCEECSFQLHGSSLIQVHHIDHDKSNNEKLNLQVLCAICHGEKHWSSPLWPTGVLEREKSKLMQHHLARSFRDRAASSVRR